MTNQHSKEPLGRLYKRMMEEFRLSQVTVQDQARRFKKNPRAELKKLSDHNLKISKIMSIMVKRNNDGIKLEKLGGIEKAIELYEENLNDEFFGTHPYERLMILYRKNKQYADEIRVIEKAIEVFSGDHRYYKDVYKFKNRLVKAINLLDKSQM